jgi:hypothetical protein
MKKLLVIILLLSANAAYSQIRLPGQWSLMFEGNINMNYGLSYAMRGNADEFMADLEDDYLNERYPFGDPDSFNSHIGGQLAYKFPESDWTVFGNVSMTNFYVWDDLFFGNSDAYLFIFSMAPGVEYTIGEPMELWNFFARAALGFNTLFGMVEYYNYETRVKPAFRIGIETSAGGRLNIPYTPLALETSLNYTNANLFGKDFEYPEVQPSEELYRRALNDGRNPADPDDENRVIDYIGFRVGLRLWF